MSIFIHLGARGRRERCSQMLAMVPWQRPKTLKSQQRHPLFDEGIEGAYGYEQGKRCSAQLAILLAGDLIAVFGAILLACIEPPVALRRFHDPKAVLSTASSGQIEHRHLLQKTARMILGTDCTPHVSHRRSHTVLGVMTEAG